MGEIFGAILAVTWKVIMVGADVITTGFGTTGSVGT